MNYDVGVEPPLPITIPTVVQLEKARLQWFLNEHSWSSIAKTKLIRFDWIHNLLWDPVKAKLDQECNQRKYLKTVYLGAIEGAPLRCTHAHPLAAPC